VADALSTQHPDLDPVRTLAGQLEDEVLPHERADEDLLVPLVGRALGPDATASLSRTHAEIEHQVSRLRRLLDGLPGGPSGGPTLEDATAVPPEDVIELRRLLYGLYAVLRLHNTQEEEGAFSLVPEGESSSSADRFRPFAGTGKG
jgi:iron-sulfur cluster repair protein YtfE (RIC family)